MSIPAEMPAEVMMSPSSTNRSSPRTRIVGSSSASRSRLRQCVDERARAHARHQRDLAPLATDPVELRLILQLRAGSLAAWVHEDLAGRSVAIGVVGLHDQALGTTHQAP